MHSTRLRSDKGRPGRTCFRVYRQSGEDCENQGGQVRVPASPQFTVVGGGSLHHLICNSGTSTTNTHRADLPAYGITNWWPLSRTVNTGQGAFRTTFSATLPSKACTMPPRPCVPMTIKSTSFAFA